MHPTDPSTQNLANESNDADAGALVRYRRVDTENVYFKHRFSFEHQNRAFTNWCCRGYLALRIAAARELGQFTKLARSKGDTGGDAGILCHGSDGDKAVVSSKAVVEELYDAVERGDVDTVRRLLNPDVDWWFHGPRAHQHLVLMRLLTGGAGAAPGIPFKVSTVDAFGSTVLAEGTDATGLLYWVHAWTVGPGGRVTEVREYCNTVLLVTRLGRAAEETTACSQHVWQSRLPDHARRKLPALVLAI